MKYFKLTLFLKSQNEHIVCPKTYLLNKVTYKAQTQIDLRFNKPNQQYTTFTVEH